MVNVTIELKQVIQSFSSAVKYLDSFKCDPSLNVNFTNVTLVNNDDKLNFVTLGKVSGIFSGQEDEVGKYWLG